MQSNRFLGIYDTFANYSLIFLKINKNENHNMRKNFWALKIQLYFLNWKPIMFYSFIYFLILIALSEVGIILIL